MTVSEIPQEGIDIEEAKLAPDGLEVIGEEIRLLSYGRLKMRIEKIGSEVIIRGSVSAEIGLSCSRCLKDFREKVIAPFNVVYHPIGEFIKEDKTELSAQELEVGFYKGDELNIGELLKEQLLLSIPLKPLCNDSCKGICPRCGADLNTERCRCNIKSIDPRLEPLKEYFGKRKD